MKNGYTPEEQAKIRKMMNANNVAGRLPSMPSLASVVQRLESVVDYLKNLEQGVIGLSNSVQIMNLEANVSRLSSAMTWKLLADKNIATEEEIKTLYKTEVSDKIQEYLKEMQEQEALEQNAKEVTAAENNTPAPEKVPEPEAPASDVVLPSESNTPVVFTEDGIKKETVPTE